MDANGAFSRLNNHVMSQKPGSDVEQEASSTPRKAPGHWERQARHVLELELTKRQMTAADLFIRMKEVGSAPPTLRSLQLRLNRGTFSFAFVLQALDALGIRELDLSTVKKAPSRRGPQSV